MTERFGGGQLLDALEQAAIATDADGTVRFWNTAAAALYGWTRSEALGRNIVEILPTIRFQDLSADILQQVSENFRWEGDYPVRRWDGTTFLAHVSLGCIRDVGGECVGYLGISNDVTRHRLNEIAAGVAYGGSLGETMDALAGTVAYAAGLASCVIALWGPDGEGPRAAGQWGLPSAYGRAFAAAIAADEEHPAVRAMLSLHTVTSAPSAPPDGGDGGTFPAHDQEIWVPLIVDRRPAGVLGAFLDTSQLGNAASVRLVTEVAGHLAPAVDSAVLFAAAQADATMRERRRVSRELHDSLGQTLYSIALLARAAQLGARRLPGQAPEDLRDTLDELRERSQSALAEARGMIVELRPDRQASGDLLAVLERRAKVVTAQSGVPVRVSGPPDGLTLQPDAEEQLARIAMEALANVTKHAAAMRVTVRLQVSDELALEVSDDGRGFDPSRRTPGRFGLETMRERARSLGGALDVVSASGAGTTVRARCPLTVLVDAPEETAGGLLGEQEGA